MMKQKWGRWSFSYLKFTKYVTNIIAEPKYKYGQQEQVTVRNHNRSTALERSVLKHWSLLVLFVLVSFVCFSILITSFGEEEAGIVLLVHLFVCFARVCFCHFSLPLGVEGWLRFVIMAYPGPFYLLLSWIPGYQCHGLKGIFLFTQYSW